MRAAIAALEQARGVLLAEARPGVDDLHRIRQQADDDLALDNRAYTTVGIPRKAQVLFISQGDKYLAGTLKTPAAAQIADVVEITPDEAKTADYVRQADSGRFDLVIYDRVRPEHAPAANALYFGVLPPGPAYERSTAVEGPIILDWNGCVADGRHRIIKAIVAGKTTIKAKRLTWRMEPDKKADQ